jgi:hypothetical protein
MPILERVKFAEKGSIYIYKKNTEEKSLLEELKDTSETSFKRMNQLIQVMCENGKITNSQHYHQFKEYIWEFKPSGYRVFNFKLPGRSPLALVLLLFFKKCPPKECMQNYKSAEKLRKQILSEIVNNTLEERN